MNDDVHFSTRSCLQCGKTLIGRIDKKFCDDQCRSIYNNRSQRSKEAYIIDVNRQIRKNRRILKTLCPVGKATVRKTVVEALGYNFSLFTSQFWHGANVYYFSYEFGFMPIVDKKGIEKIVIVQQQPYAVQGFDPWK